MAELILFEVPRTFDELTQYVSKIDKRITPLERDSHPPYDFTELVERVQLIEEILLNQNNGVWRCKQCSRINRPYRASCGACHESR
jgi:hypothetical protein